jgi:hypothetical protein
MLHAHGHTDIQTSAQAAEQGHELKLQPVDGSAMG